MTEAYTGVRRQVTALPTLSCGVAPQKNLSNTPFTGLMVPFRQIEVECPILIKFVLRSPENPELLKAFEMLGCRLAERARRS